MRRHEAPLRALLRRVAHDKADDLAQETFIAAWRNIAKWRGDSGFFAWLARIAWRRFLSDKRAGKVEVPLEEAGEQMVRADAGTRSAIDQAMSRLPARERMAATLCFAEGYSHSEAAVIMEIPLGTLKSLVSRARAGLVQCLENEA